MMHDPALSVVIPCYNLGRYLREAIASVEQCEDRRYEIIVVDDGSTDPATQAVLRDLELEGYRVIRQANKGLATARNVGIGAARGRYILPLDADNRIRPRYIEVGIEILDRRSDVDVVYGDAEHFGDGQETQIVRVPEFNYETIILGNFIDACAVFRKSRWHECGGYDSQMPVQGYEDWDFWLTLADNGAVFMHVPEVLFDYRIRSDSMGAAMTRPYNHVRTYCYLYKKHIDRDWIARLEANKSRAHASHCLYWAVTAHQFGLLPEVRVLVSGAFQAYVHSYALPISESYLSFIQTIVYVVRSRFDLPQLNLEALECAKAIYADLPSDSPDLPAAAHLTSFFWEVDAFEAWQLCERSRTRSSALRALWAYPACARNLGLISILARSLTPVVGVPA